MNAARRITLFVPSRSSALRGGCMSDDEPEADEPSAIEEDPNAARFRMVLLAVLIEGGLVLLALFIGWLFDKNPLSRLKLDLAGVGWGLVAALPMLAAFY